MALCPSSWLPRWLPRTRPQISDWEARPLSARQVTYAALDAVVLVRLWDAFHQQLPPAVAQEVARTRTAPFRAGPSRPAAAAAAAGEGETAGEMALEEEQVWVRC